MKRFLIFFVALISFTGLLAACGAPSNSYMRAEIANRLASPAWMVKREIPAGQFALTAFERMHERHETANVYIEGDGVKGHDVIKFFSDSTPQNPVGLHLATKDKAKNLAYIARPCHYSGMIDRTAECDPAYWGEQRFSPEVLESYNIALDEIRQRYDIKAFHLIGYDGGAVIAAHLAQQRADVLSFRSVAGTLEHIQDPSMMVNIPQFHYIGGQDQKVPPAILHDYLQAMGETNCAGYEFVQEASHDKGWVDKWPALLKANMPACRGPVKRLDIDLMMSDPSMPERIRITREVPKGK